MASSRPKRQYADNGADKGEEPPEKRQRNTEDQDDDERKAVNPNASKMGISKMNGLRSRHGNDKPAELFRKDLISAMKLPDTEQLLPEEYVAIADPWRQEWERGVQVPVHEEVMHNPVSRYIQENEKLNGLYGFKLPPGKLLHAAKDELFQKIIHELHDTQTLAEEICRYDLDELDMYWLQNLNDERERSGEPPIEEWFMEKIIEAIETKCFENMKDMIKTVEGLGIEYDENVVCDVCRCPDSEDTNEMVFCDKCDICVHQACYGLLAIPEGNWLCRTCALGIRPQCVLCPKSGGAMKSSKSGSKWAHVSCALWIPEVNIGCPEKMEPINKISNIPMSRWSLICSVCRERKGACIQCSVKSCKTSFHVTCAFQHGFKMDTILDEKAEEEVQLKAYCAKHSKKSTGEGRSPPVTPRKECEMTEEEKVELRSHRLKKAAEEFYLCVNPKDIAESLKLDEVTAELMYSYWILKRKSNFNKALLTPKWDEADVLSKQQEDSLIARMKMFVHLRQDLERVRNLCYMLTKREKMKKTLYKMKEEIFYRQLQALKADNPRMGSREAAGVMSAHRLQAANNSKASSLTGTFYDDQDFIMQQAYLQDENTPLGPFDHDIEHVKIRPLYRHRLPKDKSQTESIDDKVKHLEAKHAEREKESLQFRQKHQRESVLAKYSTRKAAASEKEAQKDTTAAAANNIKRRYGRLSLPAKLDAKAVKPQDSKTKEDKGGSVTKGVRRKVRRTGEIAKIAKEEAENIDSENNGKGVPIKVESKPDGTGDQPDTRLKENVQRHQLRNFVRKLVSPYKSDRPNKTKQINGLVPNSNLIVSNAIKFKVQSKLRRSSRRHALPNGFHESTELLKLRGGPLGKSDLSLLMHTPPERNAAKKAMAQMSPVREKPRERLFPTAPSKERLVGEVALKDGQHNLETIRGTRLKFDSDRDSVGSSRGGHRSSRDTSPEVESSGRRRSRRSLQSKTQVETKTKKSAYDSDDQSSFVDVVDSDSDFVLDNTNPKGELSIRLTRSRGNEVEHTSESSKISTRRSSGLHDHWSKVTCTNTKS